LHPANRSEDLGITITCELKRAAEAENPTRIVTVGTLRRYLFLTCLGDDPEINNFYSSNQDGLCKKKDEPTGSGSSESVRRLEAELQSKLQNSWVVRGSGEHESAGSEVIVNASTDTA